MAILKFGELVTGIRGSIGGTIYSANKAGPFARAWSRGPNPRTTAQTAHRAITSSHSSYWQALTQGQRDDWDTYAADLAQELTNSLGEAYYASGWNWYCRINTHLITSDRARRATFPVIGTPATPTVTKVDTWSPITNDLHAHIDYPNNQFTGYDVIIFATFTPRIAPTVTYGRFRGCHFTTQTAIAWTGFGFTFRDYFGNPPIGGRMFVRAARQTTDGRRSAWATVNAQILPIP